MTINDNKKHKLVAFLMRYKLLALVFVLPIAVTLFGSWPSDAQDRHSQPGYQVLSEASLPSQLAETSGLFCSQGNLYTVNDSGNPSDVFTLDTQGNILKVQSLKDHNHDFEALSGDESAFYIGDVGNNYGDREHLIIRKMDRASGKKLFTIAVRPQDYKAGTYQPLQHDFDAEAMVYKDQALWLFSKSWATRQVRVYQINLTEREQSPAPVAIIEGLPGVMTGIDWDPANQHFVVVGYQSSKVSLFAPFVAIVSQDFRVENSWPLKGYGQVEGVCVAADGDVFFTQESSLFSASKLVHLKLNAEEPAITAQMSD